MKREQQTAIIECGGQQHSIVVDPSGAITLTEHTGGEIIAAFAAKGLGATLPECVHVLEQWQRGELAPSPSGKVLLSLPAWMTDANRLVADKVKLRRARRDADSRPRSPTLSELFHGERTTATGAQFEMWARDMQARVLFRLARKLHELRVAQVSRAESSTGVGVFLVRKDTGPRHARGTPEARREADSAPHQITLAVQPDWWKRIYVTGKFAALGHLVLEVSGDAVLALRATAPDHGFPAKQPWVHDGIYNFSAAWARPENGKMIWLPVTPDAYLPKPDWQPPGG